jgi:hypothetical protein
MSSIAPAAHRRGHDAFPQLAKAFKMRVNVPEAPHFFGKLYNHSLVSTQLDAAAHRLALTISRRGY